MLSDTLTALVGYRQVAACKYTQLCMFADIPTQAEIDKSDEILTAAKAAPATHAAPHAYWSMPEEDRVLIARQANMGQCRGKCIEAVYDACVKQAQWHETNATKRVLDNAVQIQLSNLTKNSNQKEALINYLCMAATTAHEGTGACLWALDNLPRFSGVVLPEVLTMGELGHYKTEGEAFDIERGRYGPDELNADAWTVMGCLFNGAFRGIILGMFVPAPAAPAPWGGAGAGAGYSGAAWGRPPGPSADDSSEKDTARKIIVEKHQSLLTRAGTSAEVKTMFQGIAQDNSGVQGADIELSSAVLSVVMDPAGAAPPWIRSLIASGEFSAKNVAAGLRGEILLALSAAVREECMRLLCQDLEMQVQAHFTLEVVVRNLRRWEVKAWTGASANGNSLALLRGVESNRSPKVIREYGALESYILAVFAIITVLCPEACEGETDKPETATHKTVLALHNYDYVRLSVPQGWLWRLERERVPVASALRQFNCVLSTMCSFMGGANGYMSGNQPHGVLRIRHFFGANPYQLADLKPAVHVSIWQNTCSDMASSSSKRKGNDGGPPGKQLTAGKKQSGGDWAGLHVFPGGTS